jgi:hypothetical protein
MRNVFIFITLCSIILVAFLSCAIQQNRWYNPNSQNLEYDLQADTASCDEYAQAQKLEFIRLGYYPLVGIFAEDAYDKPFDSCMYEKGWKKSRWPLADKTVSPRQSRIPADIPNTASCLTVYRKMIVRDIDTKCWMLCWSLCEGCIASAVFLINRLTFLLIYPPQRPFLAAFRQTCPSRLKSAPLILRILKVLYLDVFVPRVFRVPIEVIVIYFRLKECSSFKFTEC